MATERGGSRELAALADRYALEEYARGRLRALFELLCGNLRVPSSLRDPRRVLQDHLADSLVALELEEVRGSAQLADLGSGAGLPALPLAIALEQATVAAVEANTHKAAFIAAAIEGCQIDNARVVHARAESWVEGRECHDLITARALAPFDVVAEWAAPLLRVGGSLIAWRGRRDAAAEAAAAHAAAQLGLEIGRTQRVRPYPAAEHRHLHVVRKVSATPERFPRRPGVARKRPLGATPPGSDRPQR